MKTLLYSLLGVVILAVGFGLGWFFNDMADFAQGVKDDAKRREELSKNHPFTINSKTNNQTEFTANGEGIKVAQINSEDGPPYSDSCECSCGYIAEFRYNDHRYDMLVSGKGWNPEYLSCTYSFGELISNEFPPDSLVTDFRIHLVDIDTFSATMDSALFESDLVQDNLMATQRLWPGDEYTKCKFDPNKTGKYPKPDQWIE